MTPEAKVKKAIKECLKEFRAYYFMPVQTGYGKKTLDFLVCMEGEFIALEAKAPGKKLTELQKEIQKQIEAAGGYVKTFDDPERVRTWFEHYLTLHG